MLTEDLPPVVFLADKDTDGTIELYASFNGGTDIKKISGAMTPGGNVIDYRVFPDGTRVAYVADQITDGVFELFVTAIDGSAVPAAPVSGLMAAGGGVVDFRISPDNQQVAYVADQITDGVFELFITASDGSAIPAAPDSGLMAGDGIFPADGSAGPYSFEWSSDARWVGYIAEQDEPAIFELYTLQMSSGAVTNISIASNPPDVFAVDSFQWAPDSSRIAYLASNPVALQPQIELYTNLPSGTLPFKPSRNLVKPDGNVIEFIWSPDSTLLAYLANALVATRIELFATRPIAQDNFNPSGAVPAGSVTAFAWAPNSQLVAFLGGLVTADIEELFVADPVSIVLNPNPISGITNPDGDVTAVAWAPDSRRLAFIADASAEEVFELFSVRPNGTSLRTISNLTDPGSDARDFIWSPGSSLIAFRADQDLVGVFELYTATPTGTINNTISDAAATGGEVKQYRWEPSGAGIGYIADQDLLGSDELYLSLPGGTDGKKVSGPLVPGGNVLQFDWAP